METLYPYPRTNESNSFSSINEELSFNDFVWHEVLKDVRQINEESPESAVQINLDLSEEVVESHPDGSETDKLAGEDPIRENAAEVMISECNCAVKINLNYLCNHEENALQEEGVNISDLCIQKEKAISNLYSQEEEEDGSCDKNESLLEVINNQNDKPWSQWGECGTEEDLLGTVFNLPDQLSNATGSAEIGNYDEESRSRLKTLKADKRNGGYCKENVVVNEAEGIPKKKPKNRGEKESSSRKNDVCKDGSLSEGKRNGKKTMKGSLRVSEELFSQREERSSSKELGDVPGEAKEFECDTCGRSFNRQGDLKVHQRLHTGKHRFKCSWCGKEFLRSSFLENHVAIHEGGATAHKCKFCPKEFSHRSYLKKHEWLHMGLKPFKCDGCEKEFSSRANLEVHRRVHTGERPFKCSFCDKSFAQSYAKKIHERLHTGEKPLQCPLCQKTFNCGGNLRNHEKGHVEEMMRKSKLCVRVLTLDGIVEAFQ